MNTENPNPESPMSREALAALGGPRMVYVRPVVASDIQDQVEGLEHVPGDTVLYAVHAADGTPMAIVDNREAAFIEARRSEMEPVSVH